MTVRRSRGRPANASARKQRSDAILAAARRCFVRKGFHAASVAEISAEAGVSVASLYQYFESKDDLILALTEAELTDLLTVYGRLDRPGSFLTALEAMLTDVAAQATQSDSFALHLEIAAEGLRNRRNGDAVRRAELVLARRLRDAVEIRQTRGELDATLDPDGLAALLTMTIEGIFTHVALRGGTPEPPIATLRALLRPSLATR